VSGVLATLIGAVAAYFKVHPTVGASLFSAGVTVTVLAVLAKLDGRKKVSGQRLAAAEPSQPIKGEPPVSEVAEASVSEREAKEIIGRMLDDDPKLIEAASAYAYFQTSVRMGEYPAFEWLKFGAVYALHPTLAADRRINRLLMLRFQPETGEPVADMLLLILYGYKHIYGSDEVSVEVLQKALWESGVRQKNNFARLPEGSLINIDDLVRKWALRDLISPKFRLSEGGAYRLTEKGEQAVSVLFEDLADRA